MNEKQRKRKDRDKYRNEVNNNESNIGRER